MSPEKYNPLGKYGPSAVRDVAFVDKCRNGKPFVSVKQRKNGQYVVFEKFPTKSFLQNRKFTTVDQSLSDNEPKFRHLKPAWKFASKKSQGNNDQNYFVGHYKPGKYATSLPPIDLGWNSDAKVGSLMNMGHKAGGNDKPVFKERLSWKAKARIGSLDNINYNAERIRSISNQSMDRITFFSCYDAVTNVGVMSSYYTPGGTQVIKKNKLWKNVGSKVGSLDNVSHVAGGGDISISNKQFRWKADAKIGSLQNINYQPQGGNIYIVNQRLTWISKPKKGSLENVSHQPQTTIGRIQHHKTDWTGRARVGSFANIHHSQRGGNVMTTDMTEGEGGSESQHAVTNIRIRH